MCQIQKWSCTADSQDDEEESSEPFVFWCGIFVDHHKEEGSETQDGVKRKEEVLEKTNFLACKDIVAHWVVASHNEDTNSTVVKLEERCPGSETVCLVNMEHS